MPTPLKLLLALLLAMVVSATEPTATMAFVATTTTTGEFVNFATAIMVAVPAAPDLGAFTITRFSELFGISRSTVYNLQRAGVIRFTKINRRSVITIREARRYQEFLDSETEAAVPRREPETAHEQQ